MWHHNVASLAWVASTSLHVPPEVSSRRGEMWRHELTWRHTDAASKRGVNSLRGVTGPHVFNNLASECGVATPRATALFSS